MLQSLSFHVQQWAIRCSMKASLHYHFIGNADSEAKLLRYSPGVCWNTFLLMNSDIVVGLVSLVLLTICQLIIICSPLLDLLTDAMKTTECEQVSNISSWNSIDYYRTAFQQLVSETNFPVCLYVIVALQKQQEKKPNTSLLVIYLQWFKEWQPKVPSSLLKYTGGSKMLCAYKYSLTAVFLSLCHASTKELEGTTVFLVLCHLASYLDSGHWPSEGLQWDQAQAKHYQIEQTSFITCS